MNLKASLKNSYNLLAERAPQGGAIKMGFRAIRDFRILLELLVPQRFFAKTVVVANPANGNRASFKTWGNESSLWYLIRSFKRSGLSVVEDVSHADSGLRPSIEFVWHNRALSAKFQRRGFLVAPGQVRSRVDLSCGMDAVRAKFLRSAKAAVRSIHSQAMRYHIFACDSILKQFYDEMYLPYRNVRFPGNPLVKEFDLIRDFAKGSVMLAVTDSTVESHPELSDMLGALIIRRTGASATPDMPGIKGDPKAALERGVVEALYYFSLDWLHNQGVQSVDLGQSHPFLDDGILRFKSKWGASVEASQTGIHNLAVRCLDNNWLCRHLLANHPLVLQCNRQLPTANCQPPTNLAGLAYLTPDEFSYKGLRKLRRSRMIDGLRELVVVSDPESARDAEQLASQMPGVRFLPCYDLRYLGDALGLL